MSKSPKPSTRILPVDLRRLELQNTGPWGEIVGAKELSERFRQAQFDALPAKHSVLINKGIAGFRIEASWDRGKEEILPFVPLTAFVWREMYRMSPEDGL